LRRAPNDPAADGSADGAETACFEWHYSEQFQLIYRLTSGAAFFEEMPLTEIPHTA
jgi:hypothetical protein